MKVKVEMCGNGKIQMSFPMSSPEPDFDGTVVFTPEELTKFMELLSLADRSRTFKCGEILVRG